LFELPNARKTTETVRMVTKGNEAKREYLQRLAELLKATLFALFSSAPLLGFFLRRMIFSTNLPVSHPQIAEIIIKDEFLTKLKTMIPTSGDRISPGDRNVPRDAFCHKAYTSLMRGAPKIVFRVVPGGKGGRTPKRLVNPVSQYLKYAESGNDDYEKHCGKN